MIHRCPTYVTVIGALLTSVALTDEADYVLRYGKRWNGSVAYVDDDGVIVDGLDPSEEYDGPADAPDYVSPMMIEED